MTTPTSAPLAPPDPGGARRKIKPRVPLSSRAEFWLALAVAATLVNVVARVVRTPWYFFWDDTQLGAYGQWYELGDRLLSGSWTILDPGAWQGGNLLAEGQWGLWSPLAWLIGLGAHAVPSAAVYATLVKTFLLVLLCVGAFLLARSFGASPAWSAVAAFAATAGGQTMYLDAPSWVTGLQSVALFAFAWWALRRHLVHGKGPAAFLVSAYLLITVGYVFGVIELVILFAFTLVEGALRSPRQVVRPLVLGLYAALLTVFVYLPGILTAPVTVRSETGIANDLFLSMDLSDLATSPIATAVTTIRGYWGDAAPVPMQYITWLVPLLVVLGAAAIRAWRPLITVYGVLGCTIALVIGPSVLGPLRYPARMMPYAVLAIAILVAVIASTAWPKIAARRHRVGITLVTAGAAWMAWAAQPDSWLWVAIAFSVQMAGWIAIDFSIRRGADGRRGWVVPGIALIASVLVLMPQIAKYPNSPMGNFQVPSSVEQMRDVGVDLENGIMTVGDVYSLQNNPGAYSESLIANLWYLADRDVVGVYTVLPFKAFAEELCIDIRGYTCPEALAALFDTTAEQPVPLADDMRLNQIIVIKGVGLEDEPVPPPGWTLRESEYTWTLGRADPLDAAGGVARTSPGLDVTILEQSDTSVTVRIEDVTEEQGEIVFSRLAWPGYTSSGGKLLAPERGYLLTLGVTPADVGEELTIVFRPPGWHLELGAGIVAAVLAVLLLAFSRSSRRGDRKEGEPTKGA